MATLVKVEYRTRTMGVPAMKDEKGNLIMRFHIDRACTMAICECGNVEHVGSHRGRYVRFEADDDCTLHFTNKDVFGMDEKSLTKKTVTLPIKDATSNCETAFYVTQDLSAMDAEKTGQPEIESFTAFLMVSVKVPPRIVVP